jgi:hypothetical protein
MAGGRVGDIAFCFPEKNVSVSDTKVSFHSRLKKSLGFDTTIKSSSSLLDLKNRQKEGN